MFSAHGQLTSSAGVVAGFRPALAVSAVLSLLGAVTAGRRGRERAAGELAAGELAAGELAAGELAAGAPAVAGRGQGCGS